MSDQSFTTTFTVDRTPDDVFHAINNPRGWWSDGIEGVTDHVGGEFIFQVEAIHYSRIRVTELVPGERVVWRVIENHISFIDDQTEWVDTEIRFEISELDGSTSLRFTHVGLVPAYECWDACSTAWGSYVGGSLRNLVTSGVGMPNQERGRDLESLLASSNSSSA
jgi:hypothetical protein